MEKSKNTRDEQAKKKLVIQVGGGGGGLGGVIVWGGALAIASLVSVSAIKLRKRRRPTNKTNPPTIPDNESKELEMNNNHHKDEASNGLQALLQDYSLPIPYPQRNDGKRNMGVIQTDSTSEISILDDKLVLDSSIQTEIFRNGDKGILFSDNSKPETNHLLTKHENMNKNESMVITEEVIEVIKSTHADQTEEEYKPQTQLVEGEEEGGRKCDDRENSVEQIAVKEDSLIMKMVEAEKEEREHLDNINHVEKGGEEVETSQADQIETEERREIQLEEEEEEYDDKERSVEMGEESVKTAQEEQIGLKENTHMELVEEAHEQEKEEYGDQENTSRSGEETLEIAQEEEDNPQLQSIEVEQKDRQKGEEEAKTAQIAVEDNPQMKLVEEEEEEEEEDFEMENNTIEKVEDAIETAQVDQIEVEDNPKKQFVEAEQEDREYYDEQITAENIEESVETVQVDQIAVEDNPKMKFVEDEEGDTDDVKNIPEKGEAAAQADEIMVKEDPEMQVSEEEDNDEDDSVDDDVEKGEEESSEGTGDSSMESNAEAIWPAESLQEFKEMNFNNQYLGEKIEEDGTIKPEDQESGQSIKEDKEVKTQELLGYKDKSMATSIKRDFSELLTPITRAISSSNLSIWIWSSLAALVVILLMVPLSLSLTQVVKLCLIGFFIVVVSKFHKFEKLS